MLYLVTNRKLAVAPLDELIEKSIQGGVDRVILREKDLVDEELLPLARRVKKVTDALDTPLIVNGSLSVAREINAWAYHTNFQNFVEHGKHYPKLGVSIHSVEEGVEAEKLGADYVLAGHVFATDCKRGLAPRGLDFIEKLARRLTIPVIGIGGINPQNAHLVYQAGAQGLATMSYLMETKCPERRAKEFKEGYYVFND